MRNALVLIAFTLTAIAFSAGDALALSGQDANNLCSNAQEKIVVMGCRTPDGANCVKCAWCVFFARHPFCVSVECTSAGCNLWAARRWNTLGENVVITPRPGKNPVIRRRR
jgi:hypothetical protein